MQCMNQQAMTRKQMALFDDEWLGAIRSAADALWTATDRVTCGENDRVPLRDDEWEALQPLLDLGFTVIGEGLGRVVLRFPEESDHSELVVKLGRYGDGLLEIGMYQNRVEVDRWLEYGEPRSVLLPPLTWGDGPNHCRWAVFPLGEPLANADVSEEYREEVVETMLEDLTAAGLSIPEREVTAGNIVLVDGMPRLADYGRVEADEKWHLNASR